MAVATRNDTSPTGQAVASDRNPQSEPRDSAPIRIRLDELLTDRGLTLTELSERVGITVVNLSILKNGRARAIRFSTLARLCAELGCQPAARSPLIGDRRPPWTGPVPRPCWCQAVQAK
jgi:putative transcriptional regulator